MEPNQLGKKKKVNSLNTDDLETVTSLRVDEILSINLQGSHSSGSASQSTESREDAAIRLESQPIMMGWLVHGFIMTITAGRGAIEDWLRAKLCRNQHVRQSS